MAGVVISPNVKKTATRIDNDGNEIDPKTKRVIAKADVPFVPDAADLARAEAKPQAAPSVVQPQGENPLGAIIKQQIQEAIAETMKEMDIKAMVSDAIKQAFK